MAQAFVCDFCGNAATDTGNWRRVALAITSIGRLPPDPVVAIFTSSFREVPTSRVGDYCSVECAAKGASAAVAASWSTAQTGPVRED